MTIIKHRRGTAAEWVSSNPILADGEMGFERDTKKFKIGDGASTWSLLKYFVSEETLAAVYASLASPALTGSPTIGGVAVETTTGAAAKVSAQHTVDNATYGALASLPTNVKTFGAKGDVQRISDGNMSSGSAVLTSASGLFTAADVGKLIQVGGAVGSGVYILFSSTIASYQSATQVTLANVAPSALTPAYSVDWGTDDTVAIQAAIDFKSAAGGAGALYFPDGTYFFNGVLKTGVKLVGGAPAGGGVTQGVLLRAVTSAPVIDTPAGVVRGLAVIGISVDGGNIAKGIWFRNVGVPSAIKQVTVNACPDQGILVDTASRGIVVEDIYAVNCLLTRTRGSDAGAVEIAGADHYVNRVEATPSLLALSDANKRLKGILVSASTSFFSNLLGEISDVGITVSGSFNRFSNCRADIPWGHGWEVTGSDNVFSTCQGIGAGRAAANTYSAFKVTGTKNSFSACKSRDIGGATVKYAFEDTAATSTVENRNTYDESCGGNGATAVFSTTATIGSAPAIASHPLLPANSTSSVDVTRTSFVVLSAYSTPTTITAFTGGVNGQRLRVMSPVATVITLANGAALKLNTGADKVLTPFRTYTFQFYNGIWSECADDSAPMPARITALYYGAEGGAETTSVLVASTIYYVPHLMTNKSIDRLGINITAAAAAGKVINLGIYSTLASGLPGAKLLELPAPLAADAIAGPQGTVAYSPGAGMWVWLAAISDGAPTVQSITGPVRGMGRSVIAGGGRTSLTEAGAGAVLPANAATSAGAVSSIAPNVVYRIP